MSTPTPAPSGKTCVFSVIAIEAVLPTAGLAALQAVVLAPTREIAFQIHDVIA